MAGQNAVGRRSVVKALGAITALGATGVSAAPLRQAQKPNILFIMADDMGYADLSLTGSHHIKTPAIDNIAAKGLFLRQGYSSSPICSPSRTALLSGCYPYRFAVGLDEPLGANALASWFAADSNRLRGEFALVLHPLPVQQADGLQDRVLRLLLPELPCFQLLCLYPCCCHTWPGP
jgi:hypothetical protein